ncbi:MAG: hypothetical protein KF880_00190 [Ferruginibacter sp.]|nr:hypothetical protein [Ferruginibacter sp.]
MKSSLLAIALFLTGITFSTCNAQQSASNPNAPSQSMQVGGDFENNAFTYYGMPRVLSAIDTSAGFHENGQKLLITGTVFRKDGKTPVPNVLIYYYHTTPSGRYIHRHTEPRSMEPNAQGQTHGYLRGWVQSDHNGQYKIYTLSARAYPTHDEPAHIHLTVKEPNGLSEYYLDDIVFDDDRLLTTAVRKKFKNRGGSGVVRLLVKDSIHVGERDIILGLNIPDYPKDDSKETSSGLSIGEDQPSFIPYHAYGPDKGKNTCPVCKYGRYHGIILFIGNHPKWDDIKRWLLFLEEESIQRAQYLKVYFVYGNSIQYSKENRQQLLEALGKELNIQRTALTYVPSFSDTHTEAVLNRINPDVENTFIIYKHRRIVDKYINLKPDKENFERISKALEKTKGEYFYLSDVGNH